MFSIPVEEGMVALFFSPAKSYFYFPVLPDIDGKPRLLFKEAVPLPVVWLFPGLTQLSFPTGMWSIILLFLSVKTRFHGKEDPASRQIP